MPGLTTGANVSVKSTPARCRKPRTTQRALFRSRVPSGRNFCLKTHLPVMMLARGGRGTSVHVRFRCRASNSSFMAACHCGSRRAARTEVGTGEEADAAQTYTSAG